MQKIIYLLLLALATKAVAQKIEVTEYKSPSDRLTELALEEKEYKTEQKNKLKSYVDSLYNEVDKGTLSEVKAKDLKRLFAEKTALNIETKESETQLSVKKLMVEVADGKYDTVKGKNQNVFLLRFKKDSIKEFNPKRTTSHFLFAFGLNNVITQGEDLENSDFRVWGSHFYEWGVNWNSRLLKNNNLLHARYGFSLMYNNLRPTDNRIFVKNDNQTVLETYPTSLKESRLRMVQLVFPVHLEFDFTKSKTNSKGQQYFPIQNSFRAGFGGFGGITVKSKQIYKYEIDGDSEKIKQKNKFNVSDFVYGVSAYVGYRNTSLYVKYDLNTVFKSNEIDQNNISMGIRFDLE